MAFGVEIPELGFKLNYERGGGERTFQPVAIELCEGLSTMPISCRSLLLLLLPSPSLLMLAMLADDGRLALLPVSALNFFKINIIRAHSTDNRKKKTKAK